MIGDQYVKLIKMLLAMNNDLSLSSAMPFCRARAHIAQSVSSSDKKFHDFQNDSCSKVELSQILGEFR